MTVLRRLSTGSWNTVTGIPSTTGLRIAADRPEDKNYSLFQTQLSAITTITGINTMIPHTFANGTGRYLLGTCDNWGVMANGQDANNNNAETYEAAISEVDGSNFYRGHFVRIRHFDGSITELTDLPTSVTVPAGDSADVLFDLGASRPAYVRLTEHFYAHVNAGETLWIHRPNMNPISTGEASAYSAGETSKVMQMLSTSKTTELYGRWLSSLRHVDAPPAQNIYPTAAIGDSLCAGGPYVWRQVMNKDLHVPHITIASSGETAYTFLQNDGRTKYRRKLLALGGFEAGTIQYFTNDLVLNITTNLSVFQNRLTQLRDLLTSNGASRIMVGCLPPNTKSTDGWTTLAGQSLPMGGTNTRGKNQQTLLDYNSWLRQGTFLSPGWLHPNGFYVFDWAGSLTTMDSSPGDTPSIIAKWAIMSGAILNATSDGLHPTETAAIQMGAGQVPLSFYQQSTGG